MRHDEPTQEPDDRQQLMEELNEFLEWMAQQEIDEAWVKQWNTMTDSERDELDMIKVQK